MFVDVLSVPAQLAPVADAVDGCGCFLHGRKLTDFRLSLPHETKVQTDNRPANDHLRQVRMGFEKVGRAIPERKGGGFRLKRNPDYLRGRG